MKFLYGMVFDDVRVRLSVNTGGAILCVMFVLLATANAHSQNPVLTVRFANPNYDCGAGMYCLDVEFQSDTPGQRLFGQNVRFFYDDNALSFKNYDDIAAGYKLIASAAPRVPQADSGPTLFSLAGPAAWANHTIQLTNPEAPPVYISTTDWTKLYSVCFDISDADSLGLDSFCPSVIWDLQADPAAGGFLPGCSGVVVTVASPEAGLADARVIQFNWQYSTLPAEPYGFPVIEHCTDTIAGFEGERDGNEGEGECGDEPKPDEDANNWFSFSGCNCDVRGEKSLEDWLGDWLVIGASLLVLVVTTGIRRQF